MKHILTRLIPAALVLCLTLTACGGKDDGSGAGYDPAATAQALLDSGAFTDTLDTTDKDTVAVLYGVEADSIVDCACYTSLSAGAEEIAVLTMKDADSAKAAMAGLEVRVADQKTALESYQPDEVSKLDKAILTQSGNTVVLVVAADADKAQSTLDGLSK